MSNKKQLLPCIESIADISSFLEVIASEGVIFHPMDDFSTYVHQDSHFRLYNDEEVLERNVLLANCFLLLTKLGYEPFDFLIKKWKSERQLQNKTSANLSEV